MVILTPAYALVLGVMASIAAHFGDLFVSGAKLLFPGKRQRQVITPGHGGFFGPF